MKTEKFYIDPEKLEFEAVIRDITEEGIILSDTYFFHESGGQIGDAGYIGLAKVTNTVKKNGKIVHIVDSSENLLKGVSVICKIDKTKRLYIMRLHSLAHLIYFVFCEFYGEEIQTIGSRITHEKCRADFNYTRYIDIGEIELRINEIIDRKLRICVYQKPNSNIRTWMVEELGEMPCCGLHVRNTREIGKVKLKLKKLGKQGTRIYGEIQR